MFPWLARPLLPTSIYIVERGSRQALESPCSHSGRGCPKQIGLTNEGPFQRFTYRQVVARRMPNTTRGAVPKFCKGRRERIAPLAALTNSFHANTNRIQPGPALWLQDWPDMRASREVAASRP